LFIFYLQVALGFLWVVTRSSFKLLGVDPYGVKGNKQIMKRNFLVVLIAALLLAPWPIVYAYDGVDAASGNPVIQSALPEYGPAINAYGNAIGKVTRGDLFYIDMTGIQADGNYQLMITNVDELVHQYRFLNMKVGIFAQGQDENHWVRLTSADGGNLPDIYITMFTGMVDFNLPGGARYKVVIETGCFYCYGFGDESKVVSPAFYLSGS
jgi:hypothetical protein